MECIYCKGQMEKKTAPFNIQKNGYYLHWDAIPAFVCDRCGEVYFSEHEVDVIQSAISQLDSKNAEFYTPDKEAA
ncbi:MAG: YgiT-type zinc finger protein [Pseudanabaena sp. ELA645]